MQRPFGEWLRRQKSRNSSRTPKRPGAMQVGNGGVGNIWHVASAAFEDWTGTHLNHVPFQGAAPTILSLGEATSMPRPSRHRSRVIASH